MKNKKKSWIIRFIKRSKGRLETMPIKKPKLKRRDKPIKPLWYKPVIDGTIGDTLWMEGLYPYTVGHLIKESMGKNLVIDVCPFCAGSHKHGATDEEIEAKFLTRHAHCHNRQYYIFIK